MLNNFLGKNVRIIDDDNMEWRGYVRSIETPEDSDDGQWWLTNRVLRQDFQYQSMK